MVALYDEKGFDAEVEEYQKVYTMLLKSFSNQPYKYNQESDKEMVKELPVCNFGALSDLSGNKTEAICCLYPADNS